MNKRNLGLFAMTMLTAVLTVLMLMTPSTARADDEEGAVCPGTRCTGWDMPVCCSLSYTVGVPPFERIVTDYYYFAAP